MRARPAALLRLGDLRRVLVQPHLQLWVSTSVTRTTPHESEHCPRLSVCHSKQVLALPCFGSSLSLETSFWLFPENRGDGASGLERGLALGSSLQFLLVLEGHARRHLTRRCVQLATTTDADMQVSLDFGFSWSTRGGTMFLASPFLKQAVSADGRKRMESF